MFSADLTDLSVPQQYLPVFFFVIIAAFLSLMVSIAPFLAAKIRQLPAKQKPYECGFPPLTQPHQKFEARFYLVSILFIIFDLEIVLLFPWAVTLADAGTFSMAQVITGLLFLLILAVGLVYEWLKGALNW